MLIAEGGRGEGRMEAKDLTAKDVSSGFGLTGFDARRDVRFALEYKQVGIAIAPDQPAAACSDQGHDPGACQQRCATL